MTTRPLASPVATIFPIVVEAVAAMDVLGECFGTACHTIAGICSADAKEETPSRAPLVPACCLLIVGEPKREVSSSPNPSGHTQGKRFRDQPRPSLGSRRLSGLKLKC